MAEARLLLLLLPLVVAVVMLDSCLLVVDANFGNDTVASWGAQNVEVFSNGENLTLTLNNQTGSRIDTINQFLFGSIEMHIKLAAGNSAGTVTSYYMSSEGSQHDEMDFEFLGNSSGQPYLIHTNVFANGTGQREQQFYPWFDPASAFHNYTIHWNPNEIVWYIDEAPIRVFRNYEALGVPFPRQQPMKAYSSIWNGDDWATQGGRVKIDWASAPFVAAYTHLRLRACLAADALCVSAFPATDLTADQQAQMAEIRRGFMVYDYCDDSARFDGVVPLECSHRGVQIFFGRKGLEVHGEYY